MSLFLGKIHYWLFDKILWFEGLEKDVINVAESENLNIEALSKEINQKYGEMLPDKPLEEMIDTSNIHGWLQERIHSAEGRMSAWIFRIIDNNKDALNKIESVYINQGMKAGNEVKEQFGKLDSAVDIYNKINDYILDGMPCDRVNEIIASDDDIVKWKRTICVHKDIWEKENMNVGIFYDLRNLWIKSFVNTINSDFKYIQGEEDTFTIER